MIPDRIIAFLGGSIVMSAASRDRQLQPCISRAFGAVAAADQKVFEFYIPQQFAPKMLDNFAHNKRVALVACELTNFETYQFKGEFASARQCGEREYACVDRYLKQIRAACIQIGYAEDLVNRWKLWNRTSCVAVRFAVEEIFCQTPGPGTGNRITA